MGKFEGKVVIVTGASSGIGAATAVAFAKEGAKLTIHGRNEDKLSNTSTLCEKEGAEVLKIIGDLKHIEHLESIIKQTVEKFSSIDILINNAGYGQPPRYVQDIELDEYEKLFQINVRAPVFLCKYAFPYLKESKGCVVNVSSLASMEVLEAFSEYSMTKIAIDHFTRCFSKDCAPFGIRVNSINPAGVDTGFISNFFTEEQMEMFFEKIKNNHPFGILRPEAIADGIMFLCISPNITGTTLKIDSGSLYA